MPSLQETLRKHRAQKKDGEDRGGLPVTLLRYLKEQYDRIVARATRGFGKEADRGPGWQRHDPNRTAPAPGTGNRPGRDEIARIPMSKAEREAWAASPEGQQWRKQAEASIPADVLKHMNSPSGQERERRTEEFMESMREEMIERQSRGKPMTAGECGDRLEAGLDRINNEVREDWRPDQERSEPVHELRSRDELQRDGERRSQEFDRGYEALRAEVAERSADDRPMTSGEYEDRLEELYERDSKREAEIPPTVEEMRAWRAGDDGRAEAAELAAYGRSTGHEARPIDEKTFEKHYGELRDEMVERKAAGDPMTSGEYRRRHEAALVSAGQDYKVADWEAQRADLRSIGEDDPSAAERNPPRAQLVPMEELEAKEERCSAEYRKEYTALHDEVEEMNLTGERRPEDELDRRLEAVWEADRNRPAEIPATLEEVRRHRESLEGQAETRRMRREDRSDGKVDIDRERFDKGYEKLRSEVIERKAAGRPMSRGEFRDSYENLAADCGETPTAARRQAQQSELGGKPKEPERANDRSPDATPRSHGRRSHAPSPAAAPPSTSTYRAGSTTARETPAQTR